MSMVGVAMATHSVYPTQYFNNTDNIEQLSQLTRLRHLHLHTTYEETYVALCLCHACVAKKALRHLPACIISAHRIIRLPDLPGLETLDLSSSTELMDLPIAALRRMRNVAVLMLMN